MIASLPRIVLFFAFLGAAIPARSDEPIPPLPPPDETPLKSQPGVKVAEKGPIHEAFAQPGADVRGKDMTAPKAPPPPITEVPPDTKPEGANVKWIPGYWQWDESKNDFIWVSGFYRNVPPNRAWEPGKWMVKDGKNIYTPGFWRPTDSNSWKAEVPAPPKSIESGPSTPSESPDGMWVPGGWEYRNNEFVWRGGYWAAPYKHLMWQPPQYVFNGNTYNYIPGYWDYPLEERGLLNAPVYIDPTYVINPNWSFTPQYGIGAGDTNGWGNGGLFDSMYYGPNYNNYYYGNYGNPYGLGGLGFGYGPGAPLFGYGDFYPWWYGGPGFYNPLWNHYNWLNRNNRGWGENARNGRGRGVNGVNGVVGAGRTIAPRPVGSVSSAAGLAAQSAARAAVAARSAQYIRPASQVLANQAVRSASPLVGAGAAAGVIYRPGVGSAGIVTQPSFRSPVGGIHGTSTYRGGSAVRSSGGRSTGGRGGHR